MMHLKLSLVLVVGLILTGCATSSSAGCIAYFQNAKGTNSNDTAETTDNFSDLDLAMEAACK
ncbi:putative Na+-dependent transporter [Bradyrhizobium diazoefficiens]